MHHILTFLTKTIELRKIISFRNVRKVKIVTELIHNHIQLLACRRNRLRGIYDQTHLLHPICANERSRMPRKCVKSTKEVSCSQKYNKESTENINIIFYFVSMVLKR